MNFLGIGRASLAALCGLVLSLLTANFAAFGQDCETLRSDVVRLHILANSDTDADQAVKLEVRDRILTEVGGIFTLPQSQADAKTLAKEALPQIEAAAKASLLENGSTLPVHAELCRMYFETRTYDTLSLPAGIYDAVRVTLGSGAGHNWWCVLYPPLCIPAAAKAPETSSDEQKPSAETVQAMTELTSLNSQPLFKPKLAIVEVFEALTQKAEHRDIKK